VKPAPFLYLDPPSLDEVLAALAEHGDDAAVISGGQSLLPLMNLRLARPDVVVDPRRVPGLRDRHVTDDAVTIGAMATASEVLADPAIALALPGLTQAIASIGHSQIRNRTTIGGSIAHADPSAELPAVLVGVDGEVVLSSARGERRVGAAELFDGAFSTTRRADEMVTAVRFPIPPGSSAWDEVARRPGDFALAGLFACLALESGVVRRARLAFSGVADRPVRAQAAEATLLDRPLDGAALDDCAAAVLAEIHPNDDGHASGRHRAALAATLVRRVLPGLAA
jgi:aerobic carbon-monoxide dehydrogenase medium subunit